MSSQDPQPSRPSPERARSAKGRARRKWIVRGLVLLVLVAGGVIGRRALERPPVPVKTVRVERGTVRDVVSGSSAGELTARLHATVRAELGARVRTVRHRRGERVKEGETIVVLDAVDLEARVAQADATLEAQRAQLAQARARQEAIVRNAERARALREKGAGTAQLLEDAEAALAETREAVNAARGLLAQAEASVRVARVMRDKAVITAPFGGVLIEVAPDPGDELAPGAPVFEIIDDSRLKAEAPIDEADAARVSVGQAATLSFDALPGHTIAGKVTHVGPAVRRDLKGARSLPVEIEVADPGAAFAQGLKVGMSVSVEIIVAEKHDVASLPTNVVVGRGKKRSVYVVEDGVAHLRPIEVGLSNWDRSEIVSGLEPGAEVIATLNIKELEDGRRVKVGALP